MYWLHTLFSTLDVADKAEAGLMLHSINELREEQVKDTENGQADTLPIYDTLALLHTVLGELDKVHCL